jgi:hypothetical protein
VHASCKDTFSHRRSDALPTDTPLQADALLLEQLGRRGACKTQRCIGEAPGASVWRCGAQACMARPSLKKTGPADAMLIQAAKKFVAA